MLLWYNKVSSGPRFAMQRPGTDLHPIRRRRR
jgi:hypothetical protein